MFALLVGRVRVGSVTCSGAPMNDRGLRALIKLLMLLGVVCQQDDDFSCSSFHSLALALTESKSCTITAPEIVIRHELHVRAGTIFSVDSTIIP